MKYLLHHRLLVLLPHVGGCHPGNRLNYKIHLWMWPWAERLLFLQLFDCQDPPVDDGFSQEWRDKAQSPLPCLFGAESDQTEIDFTQHWQHYNHLGTFSTRWQSTSSARRHKEGGIAGQRCRNRVLGELCSAEVAILTMIAHSNLPFVIQVPGI